MNYKLDNDGYLDGFVIGGKIPDGMDYDGKIPSDIFENMKAYKIENNELILDKERLNEFKEQVSLENEINDIEQWFEEYDKKVASYNRCVRLGTNLPCDIDVDSLDDEARKKHEKLEENREKLSKKRK